jgi:hypothetical protein
MKTRHCITIDKSLLNLVNKARGYISFSAYLATALDEKIKRDSETNRRDILA